MTDSIQCPVCQYAHVPQDMETCPQCDSDLTCFRLLESLSDGHPKNAPESQGNFKADIPANPDTPSERMVHHKNLVLQPGTDQRTGNWIPAVLAIVLVGFFIVTVYRFSVVEHMMQQHKTSLINLAASLEDYLPEKEQMFEITKQQDLPLKKDIENLGTIIRENGTRLNLIESKLSHILSARVTDPLQDEKKQAADGIITDTLEEEPCFKIYRATDRDTLWNIARDLYGSGFLYPVLLVHNPRLPIYTISKKDQLRYLCDTSLAKELYTQIIGKKQDRFFWKYTVQPKDTQAAVMDRYCPDQRDCLVDGIFPEPGKIIGIYLE